MRATLVEKAAAKINLTLRVIGRRADGYHELESLVAFADICDVLTFHPDADDGLDVHGLFAGNSGAVADNLVLKALAALRQQFPGMKGGRFVLDKNIPVAAGLGGGSADAAAVLRLVTRANGLSLLDARVMDAARAVGADVPVCIGSRPCVMRGIGEVLSEPLDLPPLPAVLVNPGVPLATRDVFGKLAGRAGTKNLGGLPLEFDALIACLEEHHNDLAPAAIACAPVVADVLAALTACAGVRLVRMSGSGPTCFALFTTHDEAVTAAQRLKAGRKNWWVQATTLGAAPES